MYVKGDKRESVTPVQLYIDKDIYIKEADKVLAVNARVHVNSVEALQGEMRVNYRITYKVIYKEADAVKSLEESTDQQIAVKAQTVTPKSFVDADVDVISLEHIGDGNVKIRAMLEVRGYAIVSCGFECADVAEGMYARYESVGIATVTPINCVETVAESMQIVKESVEEILTSDTDIVVDNVSIATELCQVSGTCYTHIAYVGDAGLGSVCFAYPFLAEVPAPGIKEGDEVRLATGVKSTGVGVTETDGGAELNVEAVIFVKGTYTSRTPTEIPVDVYAKDRDLKPVVKTAVTESDVCVGRGNDRFTSSVTPEDGKGCAKVQCVCAPWIGAMNVGASDGLAVEGIVSAEIVYLDLDDEQKRMLVEIPYRVNIDGKFGCSGNMEAHVTVTELNAKVRRATEIEVFGTVAVEVFGIDEKEVGFVSEITDLGEAIKNDAVVSLYIVGKDEDLYDVAKALRSDESELLEMNPDVELPLREGDKLLLYRI